ncbi:MAG: ABC transporter substrate-binding protein [Deltaproteobacteria bacterium]|nr:ABC transporter substrate-binding protein [Deltaproteobacteria bacterium]
MSRLTPRRQNHATLRATRESVTNHSHLPVVMVFLLPFFFFMFFFTGAEGQAQTPQKTTFLPHWFPQAQFAGYYVAQEKGIYKKYGLDVAILRGGPEKSVFTTLARGEADFVTLFLAEAVQYRAEGMKLVNVAQIVQKSGFLLVAKKSSGISSFRDLNGKKISLWDDFKLQPLAFFRKHNLSVRIIPQTYTLNLFLRGGVDVASAMWYNEFHSILSAGLDADELTVFFFDEPGLNIPEDGIYCLEETWEKDPDRVRRFVLASLEGWRYAFEHQQEALDIVMKYVNEAKINTSRAHQKWMLEKMKDMITGDGKPPMGTLVEKDYQTATSQLKESGLIKRIVPSGEFHVRCISGE